MAGEKAETTARRPRGSRRRPDLPSRIERIPPRSGLPRAEVVALQRRRILDGLAAAVAYHGYEDTRVTDIVELAGVSRPTFYEHFEGKEQCFAAAYEDGVARLTAKVEEAVAAELDPEAALAAGLLAGLESLAADPALAHLLLVESLAAARPVRLEHERTLRRLAEALPSPAGSVTGPRAEETARLLAGGLTSHLSSRVLAGEAERLVESRDLLLGYLLPSSRATGPSPAAGARAAGG